MGSAANIIYVDFEPSTQVVKEKDCDTLQLHLPGFKIEQLKVQLTSTRNLRVRGSRPLGDNKVTRFLKEFPVSPNCDTRNIIAKFDEAILYIRQPKLITSEVQKQDEKLPLSEAATPQKENKPVDKLNAQKSTSQEQASGKTSALGDDSSKKSNAQNVPEKGQDKDEPKVLTKHKSSDSTDLKNVPNKSEEEKTGSLDNSIKKTSFEGEKRKEESTKAADKMDKGTAETVHDNADKTRAHKYKDSAVDLTPKLKVPRRVVNATLVVILALVIGLYAANFFRSFRAAETIE